MKFNFQIERNANAFDWWELNEMQNVARKIIRAKVDDSILSRTESVEVLL